MATPAPLVESQTRTPPRTALQRQSSRRIALRMLADALAVSTALFLATIAVFEIGDEWPAARFDYTTISLVATPVWVGLFYAYGLYEPRQVLGPANEFKQVFHGVAAGTLGIVIADSALAMNMSRAWMLLTFVIGLVTVGGERLVVRKTLHFMRRRGGDATITIVLGANNEARTVARTLEREKWLGYRIVGFVDDDATAPQDMGGKPLLGKTQDLKDLIEEHGANLVLVAASAVPTARLNRLLWELQDVDVDLQITSGTVDLMASRMIVQSVAGVPLLYVRRTGMDRAQRTVKRALDIAGSLGGLVVLSPLLLAIALWIKKDSPGPVMFKQVRVGRNGEHFVCWKYRTMVQDAEEKRAELEHLSEGLGLLFKLKDDPRVTRAGRALRRYSLDELPQLWNVLKGEMSLVGPRPALPSEVEQYDDWVRNRLRVKPGMSGLWQVSGRTETTFSDYVRYDLFYIQNWSLALDLWILWRTVRAVFTAEGAH